MDRLIELLTIIKNNRAISESNKYHALAYHKAITELEKYGKFDEGIYNLPGIGKKMKEHISEYLQTGTIKEAEDLQVNNKVIELFQEIHGVGPITANKWYDLGYRSFKDIPRNTLTYSQSVTIDLYDELKQRIPREHIEYFELELFKYMKQINDYLGSKVMLGNASGSYHRGKPLPGDIDFIICSLIDVTEYLLKFNLITHILAKGPKKILGICKINNIHHRFDIEIVKPEEYFCAQIYFTGSKDFNIYIRNLAKSKNLEMNEKGIYYNGILLNLGTQEDIFKFFGLVYLYPWERENLNQEDKLAYKQNYEKMIYKYFNSEYKQLYIDNYKFIC